MSVPLLVKDINPGGRGASPGCLLAFNGRLLFSADDGLTRFELWSSDGTGPGTTQVKDLTVGGQRFLPQAFHAWGQHTVFHRQ